MKKQILTLTMCLALTATAALATGTNQVPQKTNAVAKTQAKVSVTAKSSTQAKITRDLNAEKTADTIKPTSKEDARKCFEERRVKSRENMYKELGLSAEQKAKAEAIDLKTKTEAEPLFKKAQTEAKKLRELKTKKASIFKIRKQQKAFKAAKNDLRNHMKASKKAFEAILTEEQKVKLNSIKAAKRKEGCKLGNCHKPHCPICKGGKKHQPEFMGTPPDDMKPECPQEHVSTPLPPKDKK